MSYAEQFFGIKENEAVSYANDLAFFGEDSYVYKSTDLMNKVLRSPRAKLNPESNFYVLKWAKENGERLQSYFPVGFTIGIYNSNLGYSIPFTLFRYNQDDSADFITLKPPFVGFTSSYERNTSSANILNLEDYTFIEYLNSPEVDWFDDFISYDSHDDLTYGKLIALRNVPGFLNGVPDEQRDLLTPFKELDDGHPLKIIIPDAASMQALFDTNLTTIGKFSRIDTKEAYRFAKYIRAANTTSIGQEYVSNTMLNNLNTIGTYLNIHGASEITASQYEAATLVAKTYRDGITGLELYSAVEAMALSEEHAALSMLTTHLIPAMIRV